MGMLGEFSPSLQNQTGNVNGNNETNRQLLAPTCYNSSENTPRCTYSSNFSLKKHLIWGRNYIRNVEEIAVKGEVVLLKIHQKWTRPQPCYQGKNKQKS